ncbi:hypothetical protein ACFLYE_02435 [Chloroflexota bacterium]
MQRKIKQVNIKSLIIKLSCIFLFVVLAVVYFLWGIDYAYLWFVEQPSAKQQQVVSQIESARAEYAMIPNLVDEREQQLLQAQGLLAAEQNKMPSELNINEIIKTIVKAADRHRVQVIPLSTTVSESETIHEYSYNRWHITTSVSGDFQNIVNYLSDIDGKDISTSAISNVVLQLAEGNLDSSSIQNDSMPLSGTITLVVYTRPQDYRKEP